jgi:hypothetical protein
MVTLIDNPELDNYKIILHKRVNGEILTLLDNVNDISIVESVIIDQDADTPVISVVIVVKKTKEKDLFDFGDYISIHVPFVNFDGQIVQTQLGYFLILDIEYNSDDGSITITMKNIAYFTTRNTQFIKIEKNESVSSLIIRTASGFGFPIDEIISIPYQLDSVYLRSITLYDLWLNVISKAMIDDDKSYRIRFTNKGLLVEELSLTNSEFWWFEVTVDHSNIINPTRRHSIMNKDFVNIARGIVPPVQSDDVFGILSSVGKQIEEANEDSVSKYGAFYREIDISRFGNEKESREHLKKIVSKGIPIDHVNFSIFALNSLLPLDRIYITIPQINATGKYFVKHITTTLRGRQYREKITATKIRDISKDISKLVNRQNAPIKIAGLHTVE